jgi:hypothetical protein
MNPNDPMQPGPGQEWTSYREQFPRPWWKRRWNIILMVVVGGLAVLGVIGAISAPPADRTAEATATAASDLPDLSQRTYSGPAPVTEAPVPVEDTTEETTEAPAPTTPPAKPARYTGRGDSVVKIRKPGDGSGPVLASITASGSSNFVVEAKGGDDQLLVNVIGAYVGTVLLDPQDDSETTRLIVTASGRWTIMLAPVSAARVVSGSYRGRGDSVFFYDGSGDPAEATFTGPRAEANFVVTSYSDNGEDLLVNEIEPYKGTVEIPSTPAVVVVNATGAWSVVFG